MTTAPSPLADLPSDTSASAYSLRAVRRTYRRGNVAVDALRTIDLEIVTGEMVALEGPSGSGKSTLLQLLGALDTPTEGRIAFFGKELAGEDDRALTERHELLREAFGARRALHQQGVRADLDFAARRIQLDTQRLHIRIERRDGPQIMAETVDAQRDVVERVAVDQCPRGVFALVEQRVIRRSAR